MKKLLLLCWVTLFGRAGITTAQSIPNFADAYTQLTQYAQRFSFAPQHFEKSSFDHQLWIKGTVEGVKFNAALRAQGKQDKKLGDLQTIINIEGEASEWADFSAQVKLVLEAIMKDGVFFYKISDVQGALSEYGEAEDINELFDPELTNQWIKTNSSYLNIGFNYLDTSLLKSANFDLALPDYPLREVVSQDGNVFYLKWDIENIARFLSEKGMVDGFATELLLGMLQELEEIPVTMKVGDSSLTLSFVGEDQKFTISLSNTSLSIHYQSDSDLFYLIMKKGKDSDKLGFIVVQDGIAQALGIFDLKIESTTTSRKTSIKGSIQALESAFDEFDVHIDYLGQTNSVEFVDIQAPANYLDLEDYYRGDYEEYEEIDFEDTEAYYDYFYAEEQEKYGKFCTNEQNGCKIVSKAEALAIPACKAYINNYSAMIASLDVEDQSYYVEDLLSDLGKLQTMNANFATYNCDVWNGRIENRIW